MQEESDASKNTEQLSPHRAADMPFAGCRFSLRSLMITVLVICVAFAVLVPPLRHARRQSQQTRCRDNLRYIGVALHNYYDVHKTFPWAITYAADGTPMHSWRVRIMPFIEVPWGPYDFREPWNGLHNRDLTDEVRETYSDKEGTHFVPLIPPVYRCPSAPSSQNQICTNYVMLIDDRPGKPNGPPNRPGSVPASFDELSAVIIIEIADSDIHWMEPRDVLLSELSMKINDRSKRSLSSYHGGACVLHANAKVEILDETTTEERLRELLAH